MDEPICAVTFLGMQRWAAKDLGMALEPGPGASGSSEI